MKCLHFLLMSAAAMGSMASNMYMQAQEASMATQFTSYIDEHMQDAHHDCESFPKHIEKLMEIQPRGANTPWEWLKLLSIMERVIMMSSKSDNFVEKNGRMYVENVSLEERWSRRPRHFTWESHHDTRGNNARWFVFGAAKGTASDSAVCHCCFYSSDPHGSFCLLRMETLDSHVSWINSLLYNSQPIVSWGQCGDRLTWNQGLAGDAGAWKTRAL